MILRRVSQVANDTMANASDNIDCNTILSSISPPPPPMSTGVKVFYCCFMFLFACGALFGNILVIVAIKRFRALHNRSNAFIVSVAIADIGVAALVMPFRLYEEWNNGWQLGETACKILNTLDAFLCTASMSNLYCMAFDRYLAICRPFLHMRMKIDVTVLMITICWLLPAIGWVLPMLIFNWAYIGVEDYVTCLSEDACPFIVNITLNLVDCIPGFFIPSAVMLVCYWRIFVAAKKHARAIRDVSHHQEADTQYGSAASKIFKKETKAAFTLGIVIGCFFVCWCPFFLTYLVDALISYRVPVIMKLIVLWLGYLNSTMNPVLYYISNKDFKIAYKMLFGCKIQQSLLETNYEARNS